MYVSFFRKLMRINVFFFSQHGIRAIKEFENTRVRVSLCGQFRKPIQRLCHTSSMLQSSRSLTEAKPSSEHLAVGNFYRRPPLKPKSTSTGAPPSDLPSGGSLIEKYLPMRPHTLTPADLCSRAKIHALAHVGTCDTVLTRISSNRCVCHRQAHPSTPRTLL